MKIIKSVLIALIILLFIHCAQEPISKTGTIGIYIDDGADEGCIIAAYNMFLWMGNDVVLLDRDDINNNNLNEIDILYFPGGNSTYYESDLTHTGKENIRNFVRDGGAYFGVCAGAYFACTTKIWLGEEIPGEWLGLFKGTCDGPVNEIYLYPLFGMCEVELTSLSHPITRNSILQPAMNYMWIIYIWGPKFIPDDGVEVDVIGNYVDIDEPAIIAFEYGDGRVFLSGPHPEFEEDSDRDGVPYYKQFDDRGTDWHMMMCATWWCLGAI